MRRLLVLAALLFALPAHAVTLDFDSLPVSTIVTTQFPEATFSSDGGANVVLSDPISFPHTPPNFICATSCTASTFVDFTLPVIDLTFWAIQANLAGVTAQFNVFENGLLSGTVDLVSSGGTFNNEFVDLSGFVNVTRLEIVNIIDDPLSENGIGWDTFTFTVVPACSDSIDNDSDGLVDFPDDPGCHNPLWATESPQCQDGLNNDLAQDYPNPGHIDYDGGASLDLDGDGFIDAEFNSAEPAITDPDPQCVGKPWFNNEFRPCGLGAELVLLLPPLMWMWRRRSLH